MSLKIKSSTFSDGGIIPSKYTCDGANISPPLEWENIPSTTESLALICNDPDAPAGNWVHWVVYNISASVTSLPENQPTIIKMDNGTIQGLNDFGNNGYGGPSPPHGVHRYFFNLYALNATIDFDEKMTKPKLIQVIEGHVLSMGFLIGRYERKK